MLLPVDPEIIPLIPEFILELSDPLISEESEDFMELYQEPVIPDSLEAEISLPVDSEITPLIPEFILELSDPLISEESEDFMELYQELVIPDSLEAVMSELSEL